MKPGRKILAFIIFIAVLIIGIQIYWNYIQYSNNRIQVIKEIQSILDNVSREYDKNFFQLPGLTDGGMKVEVEHGDGESIQTIIDEVLAEIQNKNLIDSGDTTSPEISYKVIVAEPDLNKYRELLQQELRAHGYKMDFSLKIIENDKVSDSLGSIPANFDIITASSLLSSLNPDSYIYMYYSNPVLPSLLKGITGIVLSLILCGIVFFALYNLMFIINKQKEISEIKNDFINNVTHEFKTPIATVSSALEAIKLFNNENLSDKSKHYLDISENQLKKLNHLVEKIMETSLLENSRLELEFKNTDLIKLIKDNVERHRLNSSKEILFDSNVEILEREADPFHFENAVSNLLDNAIKYGGNKIEVSVTDAEENTKIMVKDNGAGIPAQDQPYIFDKFYRSTTKNIHNVKGFGIGLYYTRNIIEKHNGTIELTDANKFLISLWKK